MGAASAIVSHTMAGVRRNGASVVCGASVTFTVLGLMLHLENRPTPGTERFFDPVMPAVAVAFPVVGAFIVSQRSGNVVGWILCSGALVGCAFFAEQYALNTFEVEPGSLPGGAVMAWLGSWLWIPGYLALMTLLILLFPEGRPPSAGWRVVAWMAGALILAAAAMGALAPDDADGFARSDFIRVDAMPAQAPAAYTLGVFILAPICWWGLWRRYRRAAGERRGQLRGPLVASGMAVLTPPATAVASLIAGVNLPLGLYQLVAGVAQVGVPASIAIATQRDRLYELDVRPDTLLNRLSAYGIVAAVGIGVYIGAFALMEFLVAGDHRFVFGLAALLLAAVVAGGLRGYVQRGVDHVFYRIRRYDHRLVDTLGARLRSTAGHDTVLPTLVQTIAGGLRLPFVAVELGREPGTGTYVGYGEERHGRAVFPLTYQNETVGRLIVAPRSATEPFDSTDRRLLDHVAGQAAVVAYALCLSADLQRSREHLVSVREEERRRLRRDLHDGVQPALSGISLGLDAARNLLTGHGEVDQLLTQLRAELDTAAGDLRRMVYDLRPPALDQLGVVGAVRQQAAKLGMSPAGPEIVVKAHDDLHDLPAAVEVAVYRICQEALENVRKHAGAASCEILLNVHEGSLRLEVRDDGVGMAGDVNRGVGLAAMRERTAELGGMCTVESAPGSGTCVRAVLPLSQ